MAEDEDQAPPEEAAPEEAPQEEGSQEDAPEQEAPPEGDEIEEGTGDTAAADKSGAVYEVPVEISAVLGTAQIQVSQLLKMGRGAILELDRNVGDSVDILVNKQMVARGDVVVIEDRLGVTLTEAIKAEKLT